MEGWRSGGAERGGKDDKGTGRKLGDILKHHLEYETLKS